MVAVVNGRGLPFGSQIKLDGEPDEKPDEKPDDLLKNNRQAVTKTALETQDASSLMTRGLLRT